MNFQIDTDRLTLISCNEEIFEAIFESDEALADLLHIKIMEQYFEFGDAPIRYAYEQITNDNSEESWWMYLVIHKKDKTLIGTCGYKGKPNTFGEVEIGYGIIESYRNMGLATELSQALIKRAFDTSLVESVLAHTLAKSNASVKVLQKCSMRFEQEIIDPEDGKIWKWRLEREN